MAISSENGFLLDPEQLNQMATSFEKMKGQLEELVRDLHNATEALADSWQGAGYTEFIADFKNFETASSTMEACLDERVKALRVNASDAQSLSDAMKNTWKS